MYRKATINDCEKVYELICDMESKRLPYEDFAAIFKAQSEDERFFCLVCDEGGVTAALNLRFEAQLHHAGLIAEVMEFAVDAEHRNRGLGKDMLAYACEIAKEHGCTQIEVACNQLRKDTHRFYLREGMHNFHYKFSKSLVGEDAAENRLGR